MDYENYSYPKGETAHRESEALLQRFLRISSGKGECGNADRTSLLDVGCGNGLFLTKLREQVGLEWRLAGIDPSDDKREDLETAEIEFQRGYFGPGLYSAGTFDYITMFGNLMLHENPFASLDEAVRALKPGGALLFDVKNSRSSFRLAARGMTGRGRSFLPRTVQIALYHGMRYQFSKEVIRKFFESKDVNIALRTFPPRAHLGRGAVAYSKGVGRVGLSANTVLDGWRDEHAWIEAVVCKRA